MEDVSIQLKSKLEFLLKEEYDKDLFNYRKNYIIGQAAVRKVGNLVIKWNGSYSIEDQPQHWIYYIVVLLSRYRRSIYDMILNILDVDESVLESTGEMKLKVSTDKTNDIIVILLSSEIFSTEEKFILGVSLRKEINKLITERNRKIREVRFLIEKEKSSS